MIIFQYKTKSQQLKIYYYNLMSREKSKPNFFYLTLFVMVLFSFVKTEMVPPGISQTPSASSVGPTSSIPIIAIVPGGSNSSNLTPSLDVILPQTPETNGSAPAPSTPNPALMPKNGGGRQSN